MKILFNFFLVLFTTTIIFSSCSKEGKIRKNLSGTWKVTSSTDTSINSALAVNATIEYQFSDCKKSSEPCTGVYTTVIPVLGIPFTNYANYTWTVKGDVLAIAPTTAGYDSGSFHIDFTSKNAIKATDVNDAAKNYNLQRQ